MLMDLVSMVLYSRYNDTSHRVMNTMVTKGFQIVLSSTKSIGNQSTE